jgi:hypothetical protein
LALDGTDRGFNGRILLCIQRALDSIGDGVRQSLLYQIREKYGAEADTMEGRPLVIFELLESVLGSVGTSLVERLTVREIKRSFGIELRDGVTLDEAINQAKKKFLDVSDTRTD